MAVFVDGCMWEAAEVVCRAAGELEGDILDGLLSLVDKSLLRQEALVEGEPRFRMLQMLRAFGLEALTSAGEAELTRQAHAAYYLALAEEAEPQMRGTEQARWFARLEQEHENLRAALTFLLERARAQVGTQERPLQTERALRMCAALYWFWYHRGHLREGQSFLEQALAGRSGVGAALRGRALIAAADWAYFLDDLKRAETLCRESLELFRELNDKAGMASSLFHLGSTARVRGRYMLARSQLEEAAVLFQEVGDSWKRGRCFSQLSRIATEQGQYERTQALLEESLLLYQALGDQERLNWVRYLLARTLFVSQQDLPRAQTLAEQSLALSREVGNVWYSAFPLGLLGEMHLVQGGLALAHERLEESVTILQEAGDRFDAAEPLMGLARVAVAQGNLAAAHRRYQECLTMQHKLDAQESFAACLEGVGAVLVEQGMPGIAVGLWGTAEVLRETMGAPMHPVYRADYERAVAAARTQLDEEAFATTWAEGRATPLEQAITNVLKMSSEAGKQ